MELIFLIPQMFMETVMAKKLLIKLLTDLAMKLYWQLNLATISIQILPKEKDIKSSLKNSQRKI